MKQYRKKPIIIHAIQFTCENKNRVFRFLRELQGNIEALWKDGKVVLLIPTLEGEMIASLGDWIIVGIKGEIYPCKPDIFASTYELVEEKECLKDLSVLDMIREERLKQDMKWGEQNHSPERWVGILGEEYGEYCQAVNETVFYNGEEARLKGGVKNMIKELTHVAAVAVAAIECLLRKEEKDETV